MAQTVGPTTPIELVETAYAIEDRAGVALGPIVVNGCVTARSAEADGLARDTIETDAASAGVEIGAREADALARAGEFRAGLRDRQVAQCERLARRLPLPQVRLPFLFTADLGPAEIDTLADALAAGIATLDPVGAR